VRPDFGFGEFTNAASKKLLLLREREIHQGNYSWRAAR
jgi:hypothetical protein